MCDEGNSANCKLSSVMNDKLQELNVFFPGTNACTHVNATHFVCPPQAMFWVATLAQCLV